MFDLKGHIRSNGAFYVCLFSSNEFIIYLFLVLPWDHCFNFSTVAVKTLQQSYRNKRPSDLVSILFLSIYLSNNI